VRAASIPQGDSVPLSRPEGGYQLIPAVHLALAWWAYHEKLIRLADLRVWFAAWEMRARRCGIPSPLPRRFTLGELARLTGLPRRRLKAVLRRLEAARLLAWSERTVAFPLAPEAIAMLDGDGFRRFFDQIPNHDRRVPVPRRILRLLAGGCRPALIATILGHLFRCLYVKGGTCQAVGRVKASWIAEVFGVGLRRVKQARRELVAMGWLVPLPSPQWAMNRWGALVRINLGWARAGSGGAAEDAPPAEPAGPSLAPDPRQELAPPASPAGAELAPPDSDEEPLRGDKNQEPAAGGPSGFSLARPEEKTQEAKAPIRDVAPVSVTATTAVAAMPTTVESPAPRSTVDHPAGSPPRSVPTSGKPDLRHVVPDDLVDTGRLLELYAQAVATGLVPASEWGRLRFVAAAEHAKGIGAKNPCGLFANLVRAGTLHFATEDDAQAASVRIRRHLYRAAPPGCSAAEQGGIIRMGPELSEDARLVETVGAAAARAKYRGDPFPLLKRQRPEWTRERWDRALEELER
jgi:hypothetical protein